MIPTPLAGIAADPRPPWKPLAGSAPLAWLMFLGANLLRETRQRAE